MSTEKMISIYHLNSASKKYIVGFIRNGKVYYVTVTFEKLNEMLKACKASSKRGGFNKVRIYVSAKLQKEFLENGMALEIGTPDQLISNTYNKGEMFEKLITEALTADKWEKDSIPFYMAGDIKLNGENIQIKLNGAELTNEKCLTNMLQKMGKAV